LATVSRYFLAFHNSERIEFMNRTHAIAFAALALLVSASGCKVFSGNGFGNARRAPPATNSYQAQSANQPYYAPASTAANPNVLPPIGPTAASTGAMINPNSVSYHHQFVATDASTWLAPG
jgi:hypothetical protein